MSGPVRRSPDEQGEVHGEAYCLMWYACKCGHRERIWNSRDGVTPFAMSCPSCGGTQLTHVDWGADERKPDHKLNRGQRYFADGTTEDALASIERRLKLFAERGLPAPDEIADKMREDARAGTGEFQRGWPKVKRAEEF